jgi:F0F1-type ATP synthase assembly protein I
MNKTVGFALEIGATVAITTIGGLALGKFLDTRFGWTPFGLLIGSLLGIAISLTVLIIRANRLIK